MDISEIKNRILKTRLVPIEELNNFQGETKTLSQENLNKLRKIMIEEGFSFSVHVWENAKKIWVIDGHQRLKVLRSLVKEGYKIPKITCTFISAPDFKAAKKLVFMAISQYGKLNKEGLYDFVGDDVFDFSDFDFPNIGDDFFIDEPEPDDVQGLIDDDHIPEVRDNAYQVKRGEVWELGNNVLMCGDSTNQDDVAKLLDGEKADMVFTDPPYGVSYQSNMRTKTQKFDVIENDDVLLDIIPNISMFSKGFVFVWSTWKVLDKWIENTKDLGYPTNMVVWDKGGGGLGDLKRTFSTDWEIALVWHRGANLTGKRIGSVWTYGKDGASQYLHPTQKPVALALEAVTKCANTNAKILDLFLGSGSTLIACEKTNRKCFGMELDPHYCSVIIERWQKFTGKQAALIERK